MTTVETHDDPYGLFLYVIKSPYTRQKYELSMKRFFTHVGLPGSIEQQAQAFVQSNIREYNILRFLQLQRDRVDKKQVTPSAIWNYVRPLKLFTEVNEMGIAWSKLTRGLPRGRRWANDRAPTIEEIKQLCEYPDRRIKVIIYMMVSSGIRLGAWDYLKWGDVQAIIRDGQPVAGWLRVYAGEYDEYHTYISGEAYKHLSNWMNFRARSGENITPDSWIMRTLWDARGGSAARPRKLSIFGLKTLIQNAYHTQGLRTTLAPGKRRHEFPLHHGFRKFFKTHAAQAGMKPIHVELLMGHATGYSERSYYRPTQQELQEDYLKAVPFLSIETEHQQQSARDTKRIEERLDQYDKYIQKLIESGQLKPL